MSQSPYEPPSGESYGPPPNPDATRDHLRRTAKYQRWVIFAVAVTLIANIVAIVWRNRGGAGPEAELVLLAVLVVVVVFGMVAIFLLASEVYGSTVLAIVCAALMCVPCVSLITLLVVNQRATGILQQHGVRVGFFGADANSI